MIKGYIEQSKRKKVLLLGDDLRMHSGIATMSREIVLGSAHELNWVQVAGGISHPEKGKRLDLSQDTNKFFCLLYTSPSPRDRQKSRMPSSA